MHSSFDFTPFSAIKKPWSCTTKWGQIFNEVGFALYCNKSTRPKSREDESIAALYPFQACCKV